MVIILDAFALSTVLLQSAEGGLPRRDVPFVRVL